MDSLLHLPMWEQLVLLDEELVKRGYPATSSWWRQTLQEFYASKKRQLVVRCGRRGGKSTTISRVAVLEALSGNHKINPGDVGTVGFLSVNIKEAQERLRLIKSILDVLKVPYRSSGDVVELKDRPIKFQVFAASFKAVVGGTWICAICDEVSRWRDAESGANPAFEVLASLRPTMATQKNSRIFLISSPLGTSDAHAKAMEDGNDAYQMVATAATWIANPNITEAETYTLERSERVRLREYAAIPQGPLTAVFDLEFIDQCIKLWSHVSLSDVALPIMCIDPSRGRDKWAYCISQWIWHEERPRLYVKEIGHVDDAGDTRRAVDFLVSKAKANGCVLIGSDQYDASGLAVLFSERGLSMFVNTWSARSKREAVDRLDMMLRDSDIVLPNNDTMRRHLAEYSEKIGRAGGDPTYSGRGPNDDYAAVLMTTIMMELDKKIPMVGAPIIKASPSAQIESNWIAQQTRRWEDEKQLQRDMGGWTLDSMMDELQYLP